MTGVQTCALPIYNAGQAGSCRGLGGDAIHYRADAVAHGAGLDDAAARRADDGGACLEAFFAHVEGVYNAVVTEVDAASIKAQ